jgi:tetratricopeptide (TPR) repeat protein
VLGVGLGLFGLREIPFVDRIAERDTLWTALREVDATATTRAVVVRGSTGTGKSRLVQWIARRAEEVGAARLLQATHGMVASAKHGLGAMIERLFIAWRMESTSELESRIRWAVERLWDDADEDFVAHMTTSLVAIVADDGEADHAIGAEERLVTLKRLLGRLAKQRPVLFWVDDAQFSEEACVLARRLVEEGAGPILVVMTVADEVVQPTSACSDTLDWMDRAELVQSIRLQPLGREEQHRLVRRAAGLEEETSRKLAAATAGQPLFATQLIGDWIERDLLRPTVRGFVLKEGADLPTDLRALWERRIERLTSRLGGEPQRVALELAATLGDDLASLEWRAACILANVEPHERLVDELVNQGLAVRFEEGWSFVHAMLADSIREGARQRGRWQLLNQTCGEALRELNPDSLDRVALRCAGHFIDGEAWEEALEPLISVVRNCLATGDIPEAREFLHARGQALDALDVGRGDRRRVQNWLLGGEVQLRGGEPERAQKSFQRVIDASSPKGWYSELCRAHRGLGEIAADAGRLRDALAQYDRVEEEYLAHVDDPRERAALHESRAWVWKSTGENVRARRDLERALDLHREAGDTVRELNVFNQLAYTFLAEGDWDATREVAEMGVELGSQTGNRAAEAGCWTTLGEVARFEGEIEEARRCYDEAERLDELCGSRHVWVVRGNAALLELAACEWDTAERELALAAEGIRSVGLDWLSPFIDMGLACCAAAKGKWNRYDELWDSTTAQITELELVERDVAWMAELIGALAEQVGDRPRSRQAYHFAMGHWNALGEVWRARDCRIRISALSRSG